MRTLSDWWNTRQGAESLHREFCGTPPDTQWRIPCDVRDPEDARVARVIQVLLQRWPEKYRVIWSARSLTLYHREGFEAVISARHINLLARWGLTLRPRRDSEGIHAPPASAGGKQFDLQGERTDPEPMGGAGVQKDIEILGPNGERVA